MEVWTRQQFVQVSWQVCDSFFQPGLFHNSKKRAFSVAFPLLLLNYALLLRSAMETRLASAEASLKEIRTQPFDYQVCW